MKIYIFGAGASLGSQNNEYPLSSPLRAPLIDELFDGRYKEHSLYMLTSSELGVFRQEIVLQKNNSVEEWLGEKWKKIEEIKSPIHKKSQLRLFGRIVMYIWNTLRNVSNTYSANNIYRSFLNSLYVEDEEFGIINFNYDTLLDRAYEEVFHTSFLSMSSYLEANFIKPHGSVNWVIEKRENDPIVPTNSDMKTRIDLAMDNFFMNGAIPIKTLRVLRPSLEQIRYTDIANVWDNLRMDYFYPLVFLPLAQKKLDHFINFYEQVIEKGKEMVKQADEIYIIGYRAKDDIIKDLLSHIPKKPVLHVVSFNEAETISDNIRSWAPNFQKGKIINGGFSEFNRLHSLI